MDSYINEILIGTFGTVIMAMGVIIWRLYERNCEKDEEDFDTIMAKYDVFIETTGKAITDIKDMISNLHSILTLEKYKISSLNENYQNIQNLINQINNTNNLKLQSYDEKLAKHDIEIALIKKNCSTQMAKINGSVKKE